MAKPPLGVGTLTGLLLLLMLGGCGGSLSSLNPFKQEEERLPGERIAVLTAQENLVPESAAAKIPITLPPPKANATWSQPGGVPSNAPEHLAFSGNLRVLWRGDGGEGSSSAGRLTAPPILHNGRLYVLDTHGKVTAFSAARGGRVWRVSLTPPHEEPEEGYGGGLAAAGGRIFAATGYGTVVALDAGSGKTLWTRTLGAPIRAAPTASGDQLFVLTSDGRIFALAAADGETQWEQQGLADTAAILNNVSPAVTGNMVVAPYSSGNIVAYDRKRGQPLWAESVARARQLSAAASLSDPARPVIHKDRIFAVGNAGRMVATASKTGERLWSRTLRSTQMPWAAGNMVYAVDVYGQLVAFTRKGGKVRWVTRLPGTHRWSGPVLAGGRLWLVSYKGQIVGVDAKTGQITTKRNLDTKVFIPPIIAGGRMYILTDSANILSLG